MEVDGVLEPATAFGDQVKTGIAFARDCCAAAAVASTRFRDLELRQLRAAPHLFDGVAV